MAFNPNEHMQDLKGKAYLPVAWRLVWFREEHPDWSIETSPLLPFCDAEKQVACFQATIFNSESRVMAQASKMETAKGFADFIEKAETGAVGRALAMCGYGTQFAPELDEGERIVDSPQPKPAARPEAPQSALIGDSDVACGDCGKRVEGTAKQPREALIKYAVKHYGKPVCLACGQKRASKKAEQGGT